MQLQLRRNAEDLQEFLKDMGNWEKEAKEKDQVLRTQKESSGKSILPPVRGRGTGKKSTKQTSAAKSKEPEKKARISSYDYRAWDKFDVNKAVADVDEEETQAQKVEEVEKEEDEEEIQAEMALYEKERGNELFKRGKYEEAARRYTAGLTADNCNVLLYANRAMAYIKLKRYVEAEVDCSTAIDLDPTYVKPFARRASARLALGNKDGAKQDFREVLKLDPDNKLAKAELKKIEKELGIVKEQATIAAVKRPAHLRSKKPLRRIEIEDVGTGSEEEEEGEEEQQEEKEEEEEAEPVQEEIGKEKEEDKVEIIETKKKVEPQSQAREIELVPPKTAYQFEMDWRQVRGNAQLFYKYLKLIKPKDYPRLFQQSVEAVLNKVLSTLEEFYIPNGDSIYEELLFLTKINRFDMAVMFLSSAEKKTLQRLIDHIRTDEKTQTTNENINALAKKFGLH
ncbi:RNA polymerase II-associated protein 3-like isoform X2 [Oscarella lobularis]|uniref:RNA polymerase II-associated protein 3-like isoform X2 n=1 Tax=Oscarella lobularis TaxID=121494 RepID=UPI003313FCE3